MSPPVGLALDTLRDECARDPVGTLRAVAGMGYEGVELYDLLGLEPGELRALLDDVGLEVVSRHSRLEAIENGIDELAAQLRVLGSDRLVLAWIPPPTSSLEAERAVERIGAAARRTQAAGLRFGFHNHDGELRAFEDDRTVVDRLLELDDELLFLEIDLGWAWYAGVEPDQLVARAARRVPLVHVKDLTTGTAVRHVPVGDGDIDYARILPAIGGLGVEWLVVEQDETDGDGLDAAGRAVAAVTAMVGAPT